jgi:hypothetical protein
MKDQRFVYSGVSASELEEAQMANPPPFMIVMGYATPTQAEIMHACALANGLPDIHGHYGYDFAEREFIRLPESTEKAPDVFPTRQLAAALEDDRELEDAELDAALREGFPE